MATTANLRNSILERLGVLEQGETASSDDAELVDTFIDRYHETLIHTGIVNWKTSAIPDEAAVPLIQSLSKELLAEFTVDMETATQIKEDAADARGILLTLRASGSTGQPVEAKYY